MRISEPNYTQAPNDLFDHWLPHLKEIELKVLLVIMRKTFGWHKTRDKISISQLENLTGSTQTNVINAVKGLIEKGLINKQVVGEIGTQTTYYELIIHDNSNNSYPSQISTPPPPNLGGTPPPNLGGTPPPNLGDTKETLKQTNQKKSDLIERASAEIKISDFYGNEQTLTKQDLFSLAVQHRTDWTAQEIEMLYEKLLRHKGSIRNLISFCQAIIKKERIIKNIDKQSQGNQECPNNKEFTHQKKSPNLTESKENNLEKNKSQITNTEILDKDIGMRLFANWKETLMPSKPLATG